MNNCKICILGSGGSGKSSITIQLMNNTFVESYDPTIIDTYRKQIIINDVLYLLDIVDTSGQEEYIGMIDQYINSCNFFIIVYSITSRQSFDEVSKYREKITLENNCLLIGNKCDLENERQVYYEEGKDLAKTLNMDFCESSAKEKYCIFDEKKDLSEIFNFLITNNIKKDVKIKKNKCVLL